VFGLTASGLFADIWGIDLPARFAALIGVLVVTLLGALRLRRVVWVLAALLVAQFAVLIWFDVKALRLPLPHTDLTAPLDAGWLFSGSFGIALCFALTAFIGLDTSLNFAADVRRPARSVSRAAYIAGGLMTLASALSAWAIGAATGGLAQVAVTPDVGGSGVTVFEMLARMVGPQAVSGYARLIMFVLLLATVGTGVVLSKAVGRQLSGLAGDGALPETFSVYAERHSFWSRALVPVAAAVGTFAVVSTGDRIYALWLGLAGGLGITGALSLTSIAAVVWFLRNDEEETGLVGWEGRAVAGALAAVVTAVVFLFGLTRLTSVFPATAGRPDWLLSTLIAVVFAAGLVWAAVLRRKRPEILASVGRFAAEPAAEQLAPPYRPTYTYPPASSSR
jgi:amino acid transporter